MYPSQDVIITPRITVSKSGDALIVNGETYDFAQLTEGSTLPADAIDSEYFVGDVKRENGDIELTLLLPIGLNATEAQRFPEQITVSADGAVTLP
ncbi:hypothetical protein B5F39_13900 [Cloacibacillus sp. An23]|nr:hypothetical protein B5F39_13900 [Cloacibacillus sp. An23]